LLSDHIAQSSANRRTHSIAYSTANETTAKSAKDSAKDALLILSIKDI